MAVVNGTSQHNFLKSAPIGSVYERLYKTMKSKPEVFLFKLDTEEYLNQANPNTVIFGSVLSVSQNPNITSLSKIEGSLRDKLCLGFQKQSEYLDLFNYYLVLIRQTGLMDSITKKWIADERDYDKENVVAIQLGYDNLLGPVIIFAIGIATATFLLCSEFVYRFFN